MILEGNVDPTKVWADLVADTWGKGMADRFPDAARVAAAQNGTLGLGGSVAEVTRTYLALADRLDREPAAIPGAPVSLDGAMLRSVTYSLLLHNDTLPVLTQFWKAAQDLAEGSTTAADAEVLKQVSPTRRRPRASPRTTRPPCSSPHLRRRPVAQGRRRLRRPHRR
ncbi:hypothetical protein AB7952_16740 [Streptomyces sp. PG2]